MPWTLIIPSPTHHPLLHLPLSAPHSSLHPFPIVRSNVWQPRSMTLRHGFLNTERNRRKYLRALYLSGISLSYLLIAHFTHAAISALSSVATTPLSQPEPAHSGRQGPTSREAIACKAPTVCSAPSRQLLDTPTSQRDPPRSQSRINCNR